MTQTNTTQTTNDMTNIPAAACKRCGGWTSFGGMSQHRDSETPVMGRTGCTCFKAAKHTNDMTNIPAAACKRCGGWTSFGGCSQHFESKTPVLGRTGCNYCK